VNMAEGGVGLALTLDDLSHWRSRIEQNEKKRQDGNLRGC